MTKSVAEWCALRQIGIEQLVERSGLDSQRVQAILLGRWTPSPAERGRIAAALDTTVEEITWGHVTPIQHIYGL